VLKRFIGEWIMSKILKMFYSLWMWVGEKTGFLLRYSKARDMSIKNARKALERAFTPEIRKMLENK